MARSSEETGKLSKKGVRVSASPPRPPAVSKKEENQLELERKARRYIIFLRTFMQSGSRGAKERKRERRRSPSPVISGLKEKREGATYVCDSNDGQVYAAP